MGKNRLCRFGHKGRKQHRNYAYTFEQVVKHGTEASLISFVLGKSPRSRFVDIFIRTAGKVHYGINRVGNTVLVNAFFNVGNRFSRHSLKAVVKRVGTVARLDYAVEIFVLHCDCTVNEVTESISQIGIVTLDNCFISYSAVRRMRHFGKQIVSYRVNAKAGTKLVGIDNVSAGFGHFILAEKKPRVTVNLLR